MLAGVQSLIEESKPNAWIVSCSLLVVASIGPLLLKLFKPKEIAKRKEHRELGGREQTPVHMEGTVDSKFKRVESAFRANLEKGWEPSGAAIAVYHRGKLVVDLYGGYADRESRRLWRRDTMNVAFSSTKAVCALCVAVLVDRGQLAYDDPVLKYWPEFGKKGKGKITVQWVLSHMSALAYVDTPITREDALNHERMSKIFEEQAPNWIPGEHVGYHAITYGWLVDQIIRRADPQRRSLGDFYRQEIKGESDIDFHIGLDIRESYRVTRLTRPSWRQRISEYLHNPKAVNYYRYIRDFMTNGLLARVERNPEWFRFLFEMTLNNPELYAIEQGAAMGIGTARSLAKIFQKAIFEKAYFRENPEETLSKFLTPYILKEDIVTGANVARGNGMMFSEFEIDGKCQRMIGHAGYGGQNIKFDTEHELVFCYLSNGLKVGFGDSARTFVTLRDAIYRSVFATEASVNGKVAPR